MELKLYQISIKNFKGVRAFSMTSPPSGAIIVGANGTGKTTIADAWYWLLSDQDSIGQSKFNLIGLDSTGNPIAHQDAVVEAVILADLLEIRLKKIYSQKWTKKRGQAEAELTGHTTEYFFDQVPVSKKIYSEKISELIDPAIIRTLSDPWHFCNRMRHEDRRKILVDLAGTVSIDTIISQDHELSELSSILAKHSPDEAKKIAALNKKAANKQLDDLPGRIDELRQMMPDTPDRSEDILQFELLEIKKMILERTEQIAMMKSSGAIEELRHKRSILRTQIQESARVIRNQAEIKIADMTAILNRNRQWVDENLGRMAALNRKSSTIGKEISENGNKRLALMEQWNKISAEAPKIKDTCFACGQILPHQKISEQVTAFANYKTEQLKKINAEGEKLHAELKSLQADDEKFHQEFMQVHELNKKLNIEIEAQKKEIEAMDKAIETEIAEKNAETASILADLEEKIKNAENDISPDLSFEIEALNTLEKDKMEIEKYLLDYAQIEKISRRIEERENDMIDASAALMDAERRIYLLELLSRRTAEMLEKSVSEKFSLIEWKLFEQQVNGGIREVCEATVGGVPYNTDLNTGHKILSGLDVIETLSKHYGHYLPVFIDNSESLTVEKFISTQMFFLRAEDNKEIDVLTL